MKSEGNGRIVMESRYSDIEPLMEILEEWIKEHPADEKAQTAKKLLGILEVMHMSW